MTSKSYCLPSVVLIPVSLTVTSNVSSLKHSYPLKSLTEPTLSNTVARFQRNVHDIDIRAIELLIVVLLETWPLHAEWMRRLDWSEQVALSRIVDSGPLLFRPEVVCFSVRFLVVQVVGEIAQPECDYPVSVTVPGMND